MFVKSLLLAAAFQIGPFYEQRSDFSAVRPFWSGGGGATDVLWPVFTAHRDWWRFCWFTHYQENRDGGYQFEIMPLWFNGRGTPADGGDARREAAEDYWGLFPIYGRHPHFLLMHDIRFCLWPVWMRYRMPRPFKKEWMTTDAVLFPFFHWRDDGSWGFWPVYGTGFQRESEHRYCLWPFVTWAGYRADRDTAGAGDSWMVWPLCGSVDREREKQWLFLPPLFSGVNTPDGHRWRCPWPFIEIERFRRRSRTSLFPLYERVVNYRFYDGSETERITRFGWRLVELLPDGTRVFPFWASSPGYLRVWPFWERTDRGDGSARGRFLALFPVRWVDSVDRNWAKFWTFYERESNPVSTGHSLFWGLIRWRTCND
ncbi:MAG: hypothetical protein J6T01_02035 [Kiritimatiellae bacterium]|nr:hypothetical protein [Kiritimatiellia bacterium]